MTTETTGQWAEQCTGGNVSLYKFVWFGVNTYSLTAAQVQSMCLDTSRFGWCSNSTPNLNECSLRAAWEAPGGTAPRRMNCHFWDDHDFNGGESFYSPQQVYGTCTTPYYFLADFVPPPDDPTPGEDDLGGSCPECSNPINPATGNKYQTEVDYRGAGGRSLTFERWYNSFSTASGTLGKGWQHSFDRRLRLDYGVLPTYEEGSPTNSDKFSSRQAACEQGWLQMRSRYPGLSATTALYQNNTCSLYEGSTVRGIAPVYTNAYNPPSNPSLVAMHATRRDGKSLRFAASSGTFTPNADIKARLTQVSGGYELTENDIIETYDTAGKLTAITDRAGYTQTMGYDAQGRLGSVSDSFGRVLLFTYDAAGRLETFTDPANQVHTYSYDGNGNLAAVEYPDGTSRTYHYENSSFPRALTGITDENGVRYATWTYDAMGRAYISEHAGGADHTVLSFGGDSTTVTEGDQSPYTYTFTQPFGIKRASSVSQNCAGCGGTASTVYDPNGFLDTKTDFNGNVTDYTYNTRGLEELRTEAHGTDLARTITTQWHPTFRVPTQLDEFGYDDELLRRTAYTHDEYGNTLTSTVTDMTTNESRTTAWTYNGFGRVLTVDGPRTDVSDVTTYAYHECSTGAECGQVHTITNALDHVTEITSYDAHGNPLTIVDPNDVVTTLTYDLRQRLKTRTVAGATTTFDYDGVGQLDKVTLPGGAFLDYTYDTAHRLTDIEDNLGNRIHYTLDALGNRKKEEVFDPQNALRRQQSAVFDVLGRLDQIKNAADEVVTDYGYDEQGNRTSQTDYSTAATSHTTTYTPDFLNRTKQSTDPLGGTTKYGYNALDQLTSVEDPEGLITIYTINALGDVKQQTSPDTGTTQYPIHDAAGNRKRQIDARGVQVDYEYDVLNRLTFVDYPGTVEDVTYVYDGANYAPGVPNGKGRLTGITEHDGTSTTTILYDAHGNVTQEARVIDGVTYTTGYGYDAADHLTSITYPSGRTVTYERNSIGQVRKVITTVGGTTTTVADLVEYMPFGGASSYALANGIVATRTYDADYRLTEVQDQGSATIQHLDPNYDLRNNVMEIDDLVDAARWQNFDYDALSRLTFAHGVYGDFGYTYDGVGNRKTETVTPPGVTNTYTYPGTSHRLQSLSSGTSFGYDAAGAIEAKGGLSLAYNNAHRTSSVTLGGTTVNNLYNSAGQRVRKSVGSEQTVFHYDRSGQLLAETGSGGALIQREYVWLDGIPLAVIAEVNRATVVTDNTDPAFSSTGSWTSSTANPGYEGSDYLTRAPAGEPSGTQTLDDLDAGTSKTGTWVPFTGTPPGYEGVGYQRSGFSLTPNSFTWSLPVVTPGDFRVYVRWVSDPSYSTAARYTVTHSGGTAVHAVNQTAGGGSWYLLGTYAFTTSAQVSLSDPAGGTLVADAVRLIPVTALTDTASWSVPEAQSYQVYARWPAAAHHSKRAVYTVAHAGGSTDLIQDQTQAGGQWNLLGTYTFGSPSQGVSLRADPDATTVADAVRFIPTGASVTQQTTAYVHSDHLGAAQKMTDSAQQIVWLATYEPFGKATITKQAYYDNPLRFPGQYFDAETGLHQNWNRDYDPSIGRYLQSDPVGLYGGINTYAYVGSNPLAYIDPRGLNPAAGAMGGSGALPLGGAAAGGQSGVRITDRTPWLFNDAPAWPDNSSSSSNTSSETQSCPVPEQPCPPCRTISGREVPVGTIGYRPYEPPVGRSAFQHGIQGGHYNIYKANQAPRNSSNPCRCFWQPAGAVGPAELPMGAIPLEPFVWSP